MEDYSKSGKLAMFDTNIFNGILDGEIRVEDFRDYSLCATHIQEDEIKDTRNLQRKSELSEVFNNIFQQFIPTESFALGITRLGHGKLGKERSTVPVHPKTSRDASSKLVKTESFVFGLSNWGNGKWSDGLLSDRIYSELCLLDSRKRKKRSHRKDALIAETAMKNNIILVTTDENLKLVVERLGGKTYFFSKA